MLCALPHESFIALLLSKQCKILATCKVGALLGSCISGSGLNKEIVLWNLLRPDVS